jgi:hypothetical protein
MARNPLDSFALGIGRLCHAWADLELAVAALFQTVAGMSADPGTGTMVDCIDMRTQITAIRVGAVSTNKDPTWAAETTDALNYVDGDLRNGRNRYVHDYWWVDHHGTVKRGTRSPRVVKAQAREPLQVVHGQFTEESLPRLRSLIRDVKTQADWLWELYGWLDALEPDRSTLEELRAKRPLRQLLPHQPGTQYPSGTSGQKPRTQRQPSRP